MPIFEKYVLNGIVPALKACYEANYRPAYMPELIRERIASDLTDPIWNMWWISASLIASGKTKQGSPINIVSHIPHAFLKPAVLTDILKNNKLINGAGEYPEEDFYRQVALAEKGEPGVYLVPEESVKKFRSIYWLSANSALEHSLVMPLLGVNESEAQKYLSQHKRKFGREITVWPASTSAAWKPVGRLIFVGNSYIDYLDVLRDLDSFACLFGVRKKSSNDLISAQKCDILRIS